MGVNNLRYYLSQCLKTPNYYNRVLSDRDKKMRQQNILECSLRRSLLVLTFFYRLSELVQHHVMELYNFISKPIIVLCFV